MISRFCWFVARQRKWDGQVFIAYRCLLLFVASEKKCIRREYLWQLRLEVANSTVYGSVCYVRTTDQVNHGNAQTICKDVVYQYPNASKTLAVSSFIRKFRSVTFSHVASLSGFAMTPVNRIDFDGKKYLSASWSVYRILNSLFPWDRRAIRDLIFLVRFFAVFNVLLTVPLRLEAKHHTFFSSDRTIPFSYHKSHGCNTPTKVVPMTFFSRSK